jgi:hypothetical protein
MADMMETGSVQPHGEAVVGEAQPKLTPLEALRTAEAVGDPWEMLAAHARAAAYYQDRPPTPTEMLRAAEAGGDPREILTAKVALYRKARDAWPPSYESEYAELMGRPFRHIVEVQPVTSEEQ